MDTTIDLPLPRLQLTWEKIESAEPGRHQMLCRYAILIPVDQYDIRHTDMPKHDVKPCAAAEFGTTKCTGANDSLHLNPDGSLSLPFRDGAHIKWDMKSLNMPGYVVFENQWREITCSKS